MRIPELAAGLLVTVTFALGAVLWHLNASSKVSALAVAVPVTRGEVVDLDDLRVVNVAADDTIEYIAAVDATALVGRIATVDLTPGVLVVPAMLDTATPVGDGEGIVGVAVDPGHYPATGLAAGDTVHVVLAGSPNEPGETATGSAVLALSAHVWGVTDLTNDRKVVSLRTTIADAERIAAATTPGALRLVQVAS